MSEVACFFLEASDTAEESLRRYVSSGKEPCPLPHGYHDASVALGVKAYPLSDIDGEGGDGVVPHDDPRWPKACACGYVFAETDERQHRITRQYRRADTGERLVLRAAPPGAMWFADWMGPHYFGPDGHCLAVRLPNGHDWMVDSRASNCTLPGDTEHRCWVRHGDPRSQPVTVDKNGRTCAAGAGSIAVPGWHGFLTNGVLRGC